MAKPKPAAHLQRQEAPSPDQSRAVLRAQLEEMSDTRKNAKALVQEGSLVVGTWRGTDRHVLAMALALYVKACKTHEAIQRLCLAGLTSDADVLLRVLCETSLALHFILRRYSRVRSRLYGMFGTVQTLRLARAWSGTPRLKREGKTVQGLAMLGLRESVEALAPRLTREKAGRTPALLALKAQARAWRQAQAGSAKAAAMDALVGAVEKLLAKHWSTLDLKLAAEDVGMLPTYLTVFRFGSVSTHAADFASHIAPPADEEGRGIKLSVTPAWAEVSRISMISNLQLWLCARHLNARFRLGRDLHIESSEPPTVKARRLGAKPAKQDGGT